MKSCSAYVIYAKQSTDRREHHLRDEVFICVPKPDSFKDKYDYRFTSNSLIYNIGAVLTSNDNNNHFLEAIEELNQESDIIRTGIRFNGYTIIKESNKIRNTLNVCEKLFASQVYGIIVEDTSPSDPITYTTTLHNIPTIGICNREAFLSDKSLFPTYVRTVASYTNQADIWAELLTYLNFNCVVFIHSNDINGRRVQNRFEELADMLNIKVEAVIEYEPGFPEVSKSLDETKSQSTCRVFILYTDSEDSEALFQQILLLNMSTTGYVWIVSEQALMAKNKPIGMISLSLQNFYSTDSHIKDSVFILGSAIRNMYYTHNITTPPSDCRDIGRLKWSSGSILFDYIKKEKLSFGKTGHVAFDEKADRINSEYDIINVDNNGNNQIIGRYHFSQSDYKMLLSINDSLIVWSKNSSNKPYGYEVPNHFRVATISEKPFVWVSDADTNGNCPVDQIPCPLYNTTTGVEHKYCCEGYCMDLLKTLADQLNFTYSLHQVEDGLYGGYSFVNNSVRKVWTGLVGELYYNKADMVVAPLTINPERSLVIDFTKPFKYQGITILQKKQSINRHRHPLASFLQPFQDSLWVSVFVAVHVVALALYLLDRFSPFGRYKLPNCDVTEEDALNLSSAIWFAWGVLFNSGIGEGTPRSFGGRVLGMVWAGFAMIVVASYTANLAAFLVLDRPETPLTGINDPRFRNPDKDFNYSTVRDSSIDMYFRRQVELRDMYSKMQIIYNNSEDAIAAVKSDDLNAFIWDSARLDFEKAKDCELSTSGELFGRSGYAIGLTKGSSYWTNKVTLALLGMHEIGYMEELDNKWIFLDEQICDKRDANSPATLGLENMAGVFILVGFGIFAGIGLIMFEIVYKKRSTTKLKRIELTRNAVDKWKEVMENRRIMETMNQSAKQRLFQKHKYNQSLRQDESYIERSSDTTPYTVEKGLNAIKSDTIRGVIHEMRPKLKRDYSFGSESQLNILSADSHKDLSYKTSNTRQTTKDKDCKTSKSKTTTTTTTPTDYMSLV
ncbi:glutamate [NMDA] receptor subunit 1-like [Oppia nitens]|uniref:glutamate [NMDA] receptor subunit 1-like n=1 Tax=Oppia nitens TaxID=1686743 RepID=UPI0023DA2CBE|nr:glutamate [NMDA] receptor subunit 1-like [Oppia nitens]